MTNTQTAAETVATTNAAMPDLPASLKRPAEAKPAPRTPAQAAKDSAMAQRIAARHNEQTHPEAKPAPKAKFTGRTKAQAKAAKPKATHQPSTIARTDANPAKSIVPSKFKALYSQHGGTNGDKVGLALKSFTTGRNEEGREGLDLKLLAQVAKDNGIDPKAYEHLNNGQKRMNVGNKLRGLLKAGKPVQIGKQRFADAEKALAKETTHAAA